MPYASSRLLVTATVSLVLGFVIGQAQGGRAAAQGAAAKPAYLVASSRPIQPDKMGPYRAAAGPLATKAGLEILASGNPALHVLEGAWTHDGGLTIERYRSMEELLAFWNSPGYQEAKTLRQGLVEMNFIVAIEGR
jgi:uncharacterized protein (DUF1330 family)